MAGVSSEEADLPDEVTTIDALSHWLENERPALAGRLASVRFAQNEVFVESDATLKTDDVIALIPPVAGG